MADSLAEKLRKRKQAMEGGDPTGGKALDADRGPNRRTAEAVRKELGATSKLSKKTSDEKMKKRTR